MIQKSIREGFGLTVTEALWKARPTVAGRVGGIVDPDRGRETGWLVDSSEAARRGVRRDPRRPGSGARARALLGKEHVRAALPHAAPAPRLARALQPAAGTTRRRRARHRRRAALTVAGYGSRRGGPPQADRRLQPRSGHVRPRRGGERIARRGGGGLVTALRGLVAHHDVTWIASAMTDEDRAVAAEAAARRVRRGGARRLAVPAAARRARPAAYDRFYNVVANPMLWFLQHYLWGLATAPDIEPSAAHAWTRRLLAVNAAFADAVARGARRASPTRRSSSTTTTSTSRRGSCARRGRTRGSRTSSTSRGRSPTTGACCPQTMRRAVHDGLLANDVVGFHTERWRRNFLLACEGCSARSATSRTGSVEHDGRRTLVTARPISVDPAEFDALARASRRCSSRSARSSRAAGAARRSASTAPIRRRTSCAASARSSCSSSAHPELRGACRDARAARPVAAGHPRVRRVPRRDRARGARRSTSASAATAGTPIDLRDRATTSRARSPRTSSTTCCS